MKKLIFLCAFVSISVIVVECCNKNSITTTKGSKAKRGPFCPNELIFEDNFDNLDESIWSHEITMSGGGNWEFEIYGNSRSNSYTENGVLYIRPTLLADEFGEGFLSSGTIDLNANGLKCTNSDNWGCKRTGTPDNILPPVRSARMRTMDRFSFKYGKVEIRAKMPAGDWLWPALWLLPQDWRYGGWPRSGEIDMVESRGNRDLKINGGNIGVQQMGSTLHFGPSSSMNGWPTSHYDKNMNRGFNEDFHNFQMEWSPDRIKFSVDNAPMGTVEVNKGFWDRGNFANRGAENPWKNAGKAAPFDQEFYFIFNLAIGGVNYFPDGAQNGNGPKPWSNVSPHAARDFWRGKNNWLPTWKLNENHSKEASIQVDYVRVWAI